MGVAPRIRSVPDYEISRGAEAIALAASCGLILDDAQSMVVEAMLGLREDGKFSAFETAVVESRQNGKGAIFETRELAGVFLLEEELMIHSAHEYATSLEAFYRMQTLLEANDELWKRVRKVRNAHGEQGFDFIGGARIRYRTRTRGGGRGFSCDFLGLDEAMFLPEFAHSALMPTLSARPNPQVFLAGSAVDQEVHEHGIVLARMRERGLKGDDPSLAYFEWSLDYDHPDEVPEEVAMDEDAWAQSNPALGVRISAEHVAKEQRSMSPRNFAVERLSVGDWPATDGSASSVISAELWASLTDRDSVPLDPVFLAFDVTPDRSRASIGIASTRSDGMFHVEVIENQEGTGWIVPRVASIVAKHAPSAVVCDASGPAASLLPDFLKAGIFVDALSAKDHTAACGVFFDAVQQATLRHLGSAELISAVRGASTRDLGEAWAWSRKNSSVDISPLVVVTLALGQVAKRIGTGWVL